MGRILFVTGTGTGVGKTLLTALLLEFLRQRGVHALAMKPFCTGDRADVAVLQQFQPGELMDDEVNPLWFKAPLAPQIAARKERRRVHVGMALAKVKERAKQCEVLLVEGIGGVLVPLAAGTTVADFAAALNAEVVVVGRNELGTINLVRLTLEALRTRGMRCHNVVLMASERPDASSFFNGPHLRQTLANIGVFNLPFMGTTASERRSVRRNAKKLQKVLARISGLATFSTRSLERSCNSGPTKHRVRRKNR